MYIVTSFNNNNNKHKILNFDDNRVLIGVCFFKSKIPICTNFVPFLFALP